MSISNIGGRIRLQRERRGLTQGEVASALQVSAQAVSKWERGENAPDILTLVGLARLLGVSTDWLLGAHAAERDLFEATVLAADFLNSSRKAEELGLRGVMTWLNGRFYQVTEAVLGFDAIPLTCDVDAFLCFFAGVGHRDRAVKAARQARAMLTDPMGIGLADGEVHLVLTGHPDYAQRQLVGAPMLNARACSDWAKRNTESLLAATASIITALTEPTEVGPPVQVAQPSGVSLTLHQLRA